MIFPENFKGSACRKDGIGNAKVEYWSNDGGGYLGRKDMRKNIRTKIASACAHTTFGEARFGSGSRGIDMSLSHKTGAK